MTTKQRKINIQWSFNGPCTVGVLKKMKKYSRGFLRLLIENDIYIEQI
jgi:hypothetical protein